MNNTLTGFAIQTACSNCDRSDRATAIVRPGKSRREMYLCAKCMLSAVGTLNYMDGAQPEDKVAVTGGRWVPVSKIEGVSPVFMEPTGSWMYRIHTGAKMFYAISETKAVAEERRKYLLRRLNGDWPW